MRKDLEELITLTNFMINTADPSGRITFAQRLVTGLGRLLACPPEIIEQLCAAIEKDIKTFSHSARAEATDVARNHVAMFRIFLLHRQPIMDDLKKAGINLDAWL